MASLTFSGFIFVNIRITFLLTKSLPDNSLASAFPSLSSSTMSSFSFSSMIIVTSSLRAASAFLTVASPPCSAAYL
jgi:hypothetical protein